MSKRSEVYEFKKQYPLEFDYNSQLKNYINMQKIRKGQALDVSIRSFC